MDVNFLLKHEQIALMHASLAVTEEMRDTHQSLARFYGDRLRQVAFPTRSAIVEAR